MDESTYHLLIRACGEAGFVDQSFLIFDEMQKHGYLPSLQAYNALLHACTAVDDSAEGLKKVGKGEGSIWLVVDSTKESPLLRISFCLFCAYRPTRFLSEWRSPVYIRTAALTLP